MATEGEICATWIPMRSPFEQATDQTSVGARQALFLTPDMCRKFLKQLEFPETAGNSSSFFYGSAQTPRTASGVLQEFCVPNGVSNFLLRAVEHENRVSITIRTNRHKFFEPLRGGAGVGSVSRGPHGGGSQTPRLSTGSSNSGRRSTGIGIHGLSNASRSKMSRNGPHGGYDPTQPTSAAAKQHLQQQSFIPEDQTTVLTRELCLRAGIYVPPLPDPAGDAGAGANSSSVDAFAEHDQRSVFCKAATFEGWSGLSGTSYGYERHAELVGAESLAGVGSNPWPPSTGSGAGTGGMLFGGSGSSSYRDPRLYDEVDDFLALSEGPSSPASSGISTTSPKIRVARRSKSAGASLKRPPGGRYSPSSPSSPLGSRSRGKSTKAATVESGGVKATAEAPPLNQKGSSISAPAIFRFKDQVIGTAAAGATTERPNKAAEDASAAENNSPPREATHKDDIGIQLYHPLSRVGRRTGAAHSFGHSSSGSNPTPSTAATTLLPGRRKNKLSTSARCIDEVVQVAKHLFERIRCERIRQMHFLKKSQYIALHFKIEKHSRTPCFIFASVLPEEELCIEKFPPVMNHSLSSIGGDMTMTENGAAAGAPPDAWTTSARERNFLLGGVVHLKDGRRLHLGGAHWSAQEDGAGGGVGPGRGGGGGSSRLQESGRKANGTGGTTRNGIRQHEFKNYMKSTKASKKGRGGNKGENADERERAASRREMNIDEERTPAAGARTLLEDDADDEDEDEGLLNQRAKITITKVASDRSIRGSFFHRPGEAEEDDDDDEADGPCYRDEATLEGEQIVDSAEANEQEQRQRPTLLQRKASLSQTRYKLRKTRPRVPSPVFTTQPVPHSSSEAGRFEYPPPFLLGMENLKFPLIHFK
eukprot:g801.t1